ncbi:alpha/beta hydrolase [Rhodoferax sp. OV413]|uniref:alpha/beta hydrolase n=1 Tax=Rhodoferax sp. OV413 TaxID=1855285 RepID=UPI000B870EB0|nr:alpha/beta fold hydrolase [Rhodoferax sp. OV413]
MTEHEVSIHGLQGILAMPEGLAPVPAILILAGSGPVDRDGNLPGARNNCLKLLAASLTNSGIASLRIDKRGVGRSRSIEFREDELRFDTYIEDAIAWVKFLQGQARVAGVALLGHSEGALVATLAAQRCDLSGLVLIAGASEPAAQVIERQLAAASVPTALQRDSRRIASSLERGERVTTVPSELHALYRPSVQNYLMSWFPLHPAQELSKANNPTLVIQGTTDLQVGVEDARRLAAVRPGSTLVLVEGMNHILKIASSDRTENLMTYDMPDLPLADSLSQAISTFLGFRRKCPSSVESTLRFT